MCVWGDAPSIRAIDGAKKAQQKTQPASIVRAGAERFVPDWLKNQGKTFWDGFGDAFMAEANDALDGIKNAPEAIQEAWSAFLADPTGFVWDFVKAGLRDLGETLDLIQVRSNPRHPYEVGKDNGKLAFRALGFLGGAGLTGLAARAPKLLKLLKGKRQPKGDAPSLAAADDVAGGGAADQGGLNLFKWNDPTSTNPTGWRTGDRFLYLPDKGNARANWKQNSSRLRGELRNGRPIYETFVDDTGDLIPTKGFLNAERNLVMQRGWNYNSSTRSWMPPTQ